MSTPSLQTSLAELVAFARENGGNELPRIVAACRVVERKIERLGARRSVRAIGRTCQRCRKGCHGILCYSCWHEVPETFARLWKSARTDGAKREVIRALLDYLAAHPMEAR